ncbi:hypothetical protein BCR43DRAFT_563385 [Syncephalastrum racemosum]|uniref:Uncharacterized protein n=1 Tax=Syncephalastrum racemosum TaxID=13706 RepID=A0A1X2HGL6_SYNRA|nr:hypothetical protein BCR43DRAFT_563385 [Syncephalastrum racemosum]
MTNENQAMHAPSLFVRLQQEDKLSMTNDLASVLPPTVTSTPLHRKQHRHHVKRKMGGRAQVNKVVPGRSAAVHTDTEAEEEHKQASHPLRRTRSQQFDRTCMTFPQQEANTVEKDHKSPRRRSYPASFVSHQALAAPVEQTFNAEASNLVPPDRAAYPAAAAAASSTSNTAYDTTTQSSASSSSGISSRTPSTANARRLPHHQHHHHPQARLLRSQFISRPTTDTNDTSTLQREQDRIDKEYRCLKRYCDPMTESLSRCLQKASVRRQLNRSRSTFDARHTEQMARGWQPSQRQQHQQQQQRQRTNDPVRPVHLSHIQIAHQRHQKTKHVQDTPLGSFASYLSSSSDTSSSPGLFGIRWADSIWYRIVAGSSQ